MKEPDVIATPPPTPLYHPHQPPTCGGYSAIIAALASNARNYAVDRYRFHSHENETGEAVGRQVTLLNPYNTPPSGDSAPEAKL